MSLNFAAKNFEVSLNNQILPAEVKTLAVTNITGKSAVLNGSVKANTADVKTSFEVGILPDLKINFPAAATLNETVVSGSGFQPVSYNLDVTAPGTYYYRVVATNTANVNEVTKGAILNFDVPAEVLGIFRDSNNPFHTKNGVVHYFVKFSGAVTGLSKDNFTMQQTGNVSGATISSVTVDPTDPNNWWISVKIGNGGDGSLKLTLANDNNLNYKVNALPVEGEVYDINVDAPAAPTGFFANAGDGEVILKWDANKESDIASYALYYGENAKPVTFLSSATGLSYVHTGLKNGTPYNYKLVAIDVAGNVSLPATPVSATPKAGQAPKVEQHIVFSPLSDKTVGDSDFDLKASVDSPLEITFSSSDASVVSIIGKTVHILKAGQVYIYADQTGNPTYNAAGQQSQLLNILPDNKAPEMVQGFTANAGDGQVRLDWIENKETDLDYYTIRAGTASNPSLVLTTVPAGSGTYLDLAVVNGTTYYYTIQARDKSGNESLVSQEVSATPQAGKVMLDAQVIDFKVLPAMVYGDGDLKLTTYASSSSGLAVKFSSSDPSVATISSGHLKVLHAGKVMIYADVDANNVYAQAGTVSRELVIAPFEVSVTADAKFKVPGSADPVLTFSSSPASLIGSDSFSGSLKRTPGEGLGSYDINIGSLLISNDYNISFTPAKLTIGNQAAQIITINPSMSKTYGDADIDPGAVSDSGLGVIYSSSDDHIATIINNKVHILHSGTVTIYADQQGNNQYNAAQQKAMQLTVDKLKITVTADIKSKAYGTIDPVLTYKANTLVAGDVFSGGLSRVAGENAGTYAINIGSLALSDDYTINYTGETFWINKLALQVVPDVQSKVYGTADPLLSYTFNQGTLVAGDAISGSLSRSPGEDVGAYPLNIGTLSAGPNYSISLLNAMLYVTPAPISVTADDATKKIGDADPVFSYHLTSGALIGQDLLTGNLNREPGESVGHYLINQGTLSGGKNYFIAFTSGIFNILLKPVSDFKLDANNILSPNGDGKNDKLLIKGLEQYPPARISIMDREGRMIYSSPDYQNDWDGRYNGSPLATGTYYYILDFGQGTGKFKNFITILNQ